MMFWKREKKIGQRKFGRKKNRRARKLINCEMIAIRKPNVQRKTTNGTANVQHLQPFHMNSVYNFRSITGNILIFFPGQYWLMRLLQTHLFSMSLYTLQNHQIIIYCNILWPKNILTAVHRL